MGNTARSYDYTVLEDVNFTSNEPCSLGNIIAKNNCVVYRSNPVTIKIDNFNNELSMTQWDPANDVYDDIYSNIESLLSIDKKEQLVINRMAKKWYVLVGQLNEDGTYDKFAQAYVNYIWEKNWTISGAIEWLSSRPRNQKAVTTDSKIGWKLRYARSREELKNWWILKNDWTAFVFAYLPEIAKQKLDSKRVNILQTIISDSAKSLLGDENDVGMDIINAVKANTKK
ncbi:MAG: hypothetical protein ACD_49C00038G0006 [uncultured bacterium (gcode 4)]|uniref:Uncharacterized protein n=1 Tax=uncultured bacterium (gcode 4) TaxID=1234023 RepID=K2AXH8_9BACT|nr:MAG: hypothetical protein ACD_49C00038G0006 [uncultured bacterium (gcode 4)]